MNVDTGNIVDLETMRKNIAAGEPAENYIEIDTTKLTPDQAKRLEENNQPVILPNDVNSFAAIFKNEYRNKPCPCGSNVKFKKCCLSKYRIAKHMAEQELKGKKK